MVRRVICAASSCRDSLSICLSTTELPIRSRSRYSAISARSCATLNSSSDEGILDPSRQHSDVFCLEYVLSGLVQRTWVGSSA